jgi:hypothetical protein
MGPISRPVLRVVGNGAPFVANAQAHQAYFFAGFAALDD